MSSIVQGREIKSLEIKNKVLNDIYFGVVLMLIPIIVISWFRYSELKRMDLFYITVSIPLTLTVIYFLRNKIPFLIRAWSIIAILYVAGVIAYVEMSVLSVGLALLFGSSLIATMLLSANVSRLISFINGMSLVIIAIFSMNHFFEYDFEFNNILESKESWGIQIMGFTLMVLTIALGVRRIHTFNENFIDELQSKNDEINEKLETINSMDLEIQSKHKELNTTKKSALTNETIYKTLFNNLENIVYSMDMDGQLKVVNNNFLEVFQLDRENIYDRNIYDLFNYDEKNIQWESLKAQVNKTGEKETIFQKIHSPNGEIKTYEVSLVPIFIEGEICQLMGTSRDITDLLNKDETIQRLTSKDSLTGLNNQIAFSDFTQELIRNYTVGTHPFALTIIDIDDFKTTNNSMGHLKGDELITVIANMLDKELTDITYLARLGGDEFAIIMQITKALDETDYISEKIKHVFQSSFSFYDTEYQLSVSTGTSIYPYDGKTYNELFSNADLALSEAKKKGTNQHLYFNRL